MTLQNSHITHIMDRRSRNRQMLIDNDKTDNSYDITDKKKNTCFPKKNCTKLPTESDLVALLVNKEGQNLTNGFTEPNTEQKTWKKNTKFIFSQNRWPFFSCSCTSRTQTDQQTEWWTITNHYNQSLQARRIASNPTRSLTPKVALNKKIPKFRENFTITLVG